MSVVALPVQISKNKWKNISKNKIQKHFAIAAHAVFVACSYNAILYKYYLS